MRDAASEMPRSAAAQPSTSTTTSESHKPRALRNTQVLHTSHIQREQPNAGDKLPRIQPRDGQALDERAADSRSASAPC